MIDGGLLLISFSSRDKFLIHYLSFLIVILHISLSLSFSHAIIINVIYTKLEYDIDFE